MFGPEIELIECQQLYNLLNEGADYPRISDPYYLYLIDCRPRADYNQGHIIAAKNIKTNDDNSFRLPYEAELHSRNNIIVYDGNTSSLIDETRAVECARFLSESGSKYSVKILRGGYETFSRFYPFLRTQQIIYMPRELDDIKTYPSEIIPGLLYLGNFRHGTEPYIRKDLKLKAYIDCTNDTAFKFNDNKYTDYLKIPIEDDPNESIIDYIDKACQFLDLNIRDRKFPCLVYSELGISRSAAIVIAYLVFSERISIKEALDRVLECKKVQPQIKFLDEIAEKYVDRTQLF